MRFKGTEKELVNKYKISGFLHTKTQSFGCDNIKHAVFLAYKP